MEDQNQTGAPSDQGGSSDANPPASPEPSSVNMPATPPEPVPAPQQPEPVPQPVADYIPPTAVPMPGTVVSTAQTNTLAIVSLIASIASWLIIPGLGAIIGIICAIIARNQIKASAGQQTGDGLAIAGLIIGGINIVLMCLVLLCFVTGMAATFISSSGGSR